ncbi:LLM class flavin-dependent oxidoreductase [Dactylosporangium sp. NPDC049742]|uniref:LLM class flavin-dependent oxidoreductase n=1 Tax=Dactylosporangium sp. NPDC049742 TaxID=3154737 RepID=UPI0034306C9A
MAARRLPVGRAVPAGHGHARRAGGGPPSAAHPVRSLTAHPETTGRPFPRTLACWRQYPYNRYIVQQRWASKGLRAVKFGLAIMNDFPQGTIAADRVGELREQVSFARECGIDSIWLLHHYLGSMPTLQPVPTLAALAQQAEGMHIGTNMFILPLHHPVQVAETFATLDHLSGGRAIAGFGMGYRENEFAAFGIPLDERVSRYTESVEIIRALWSGEPVTYAGKHYSLDDARISLPPVQQGGPPIWVGAGMHKTGARRAAQLGDAWIVPPHASLAKLAELVQVERAERARLGRPLNGEVVVRRELVLDRDRERARERGIRARLGVTQQYAKYNAPDATAQYRHLQNEAAAAEVADEAYLFTDPATCVAKLRELEEAGVTTVILRAQWYDLPHEDMLATLKLFADEVLPALGQR